MTFGRSRLARAVWVVAAGILLSRVLGFGRNVVLAGRLGASPVADAYEAAFIVPDFLNYLLAGGFLTITFIPILSEYRASDDDEGAQAAFNAVFWPVALAITLLTALFMAAADTVVGWMFGSEGRLGPSQLAEITRLTRLVLPAQICFVLGGLFMAVQYVHGRFLLPVLAPIIYNVGIIAGGLVGTRSGNVSATGFIVGAVVGGLLGNLLLQWWGARRTGLRLRLPRPDFRHAAFREYLRLAIPLMIGQSIVVLDESLGKIVAASAPEGSIFALNLARRVNMVPVGVIAQAVGVVSYPYLARLVAEGRRSEMLDEMGRTVRLVIVAGGLAVAGVIAVSRPAVRAAFQHGEFSTEATVLTAAALVGYSLSIPAWGVHQVFARGFYAYRRMWVPVVVGTAWTIPAIPLFMGGLRIGGVPGVAVASSIILTGHAVSLGLLWGRYHSSAGLEGVLGTVMRTAGATALAAFGGYLAADVPAGRRIPDFGAALLSTLAGLGAVVVIYFLMTFMTGPVEVRAAVRRRFRLLRSGFGE